MAEKKHKVALTIWERIQISIEVLTQGRGIREMLRADDLRLKIDPDPKEQSTYTIQRNGPDGWKHPTNIAEIQSADSEREFEFLPSDYDYVRDCLELMMRKRVLPTSGGWSQLIRKFYDVQELADLAEKIDPVK